MDTDWIKTEKKRLRREMLLRRKALSDEYRNAAGECIQDKLLSSPLYEAARSIFVYISMPGEPSTGRIIRQAFADGKSIYVPKCTGGQMLAVRISGMDGLRPGMLGIPEPEDLSDTKTAEELDLIIVPCVSASEDGSRLGRGGGYYDRFLGGERGSALCLCFREMLCPDIPTEETDVRIPQVITE